VAYSTQFSVAAEERAASDRLARFHLPDTWLYNLASAYKYRFFNNLIALLSPHGGHVRMSVATIISKHMLTVVYID
jgi:hypothetical protein